MGNVKTGLKQRLEYVFPKEYNFYKKNLDVEDNKIFLKSNYCIDCVKEEDIWFKFYFMYGTQDSNNMCMNNLNGAGGNNIHVYYWRVCIWLVTMGIALKTRSELKQIKSMLFWINC